MDLGIDGRWALVCGASKGLGLGCARALVRGAWTPIEEFGPGLQWDFRRGEQDSQFHVLLSGEDRGMVDWGQMGTHNTMNALAAVASQAGGLENVRIIKVVGFVASADGFTAQPQVINGASEVIGDVLGELGVHARSAVGVAALPLNAPVEVEVVAEVL